jgi:hypothetical protein
MREFLTKMVGKKLDVYCGGTSSLSGKVVKVEESVVHLVDEDDRMYYVAIDRIAVVSEAREREKNAGFVSGFTGK